MPPEKSEGIFSCFPCVSAVLADAHRLMYCFGFVLPRTEDCNDQSRQCEEQPPDGNPPPTNAHPPDDAVMLTLQLRFGNCLYVNVLALAFGTNHIFSTPFFEDAYIV